MTQVAAQLTPSDAPTVAGAFVWAYQALTGNAPPARESWLYPLALSAFETAHWKALWNFNLGNVTNGACRGAVQGDRGYYTNPHVTVPLQFSAWSSLGAGARGELQTLQCMGALAAADRADYAGFMQALESGCYAGCVPYPSLAATIDGLAGTVPATYSPGLSRGAVLAGLAIAALGGAAAFWIHRGMPMPSLPLLGRA